MQNLELCRSRLHCLNSWVERTLLQQSVIPLPTRSQRLFEVGFCLLVHTQSPHPAEKTIYPFHPFGIPWLHHFQRAHEHLIEAERIRSILLQNVIGVDYVSARFGHFLPVFTQDEAL